MATASSGIEALLPKQREVLSASAKPARAWGAYPTGGLAVALQLGHRVSADFAWFTVNTIPPDRLLDDIAATGLSVAVRQNDEGTFLGQVDGLEYSDFRYRYDVVCLAREVEGCRLGRRRSPVPRWLPPRGSGRPSVPSL